MEKEDLDKMYWCSGYLYLCALYKAGSDPGRAELLSEVTNNSEDPSQPTMVLTAE